MMCFNKKNSEKGITLIVVVVTVIIILILAMTVILTLKDEYIPERLEENTARTVINVINEKYVIAYGQALKILAGRVDLLTDEYFKDVVPDKYKDELEATKDGLIYIGEDESVKLIAKDMGLIIKDEITEIINENIKEISLTATVDKINISVVLNENSKVIQEYTYKVREEGNAIWPLNPDISTNPTYTKTGLKSNTTYDVQVGLKDITGEETVSSIYKIKTYGLEAPTFDYLSDDWTNKVVVVKINYPSTSNIQKQWSYTGAENDWNTVSSDTYTINIDKNTNIYARVISGTNSSEVVQKVISNIDKLKPNDFLVNVLNETTNSVTVNANTTDKEATTEDGKSGIRGYMFSKDEGKTWSNEQVTSNYIFENVLDATKLNIVAKAVDKAGNEILSSGTEISTLALPKPLINSSPTEWTRGIVDVNIAYVNKADTTRQYSLNGNDWTNVSELSKTIQITDNNTVVYARLIDNKGQSSEVATLTILNIDKNPPEDFNPIFISKTTNSIKVRGATVDKATENSGTCGLKGYQFRVNGGEWSPIQTMSIYNFENLIQDTLYKIQIKAVDNIGNERITGELEVITHKIPDGSTSIIMQPDKTDWTKDNVLVTVSFPEQSNWLYLTLMVSQDNVNWITYENPMVVETNKTVYAKLVDNTNQEGTKASLDITNIDKKAPIAGTMILKQGSSTGLAYTNDTWTNQDVYIEKVDGTDDLSGHKTTTYEVSGANTVAAGTTLPTTLINAGNSTIIVTTTDIVGNVSTRNYIVKIDKTLPTATILPNGGEYTIPTGGNVATLQANLSAADAGGSGLGTVQYAWSTVNSEAEPISDWTNYTATGENITKIDAVVGTYYLWTKVVDTAGNRATTIQKSNAFIVRENTDPLNIITLTATPTSWTNGNVDVTITYGNVISQNRKYGIGSATTNATINPATQVVTTNGTVYAEATDIAGNKITATLQITNIDKTLPTATIFPNGGEYTIPTSGTVATLKANLSASDTGGSGLGTVQYAWSEVNVTTEPATGWTNYTATGADITKTDAVVGTYYLWTKVVDNAGNRAVNVQKSNAFNVRASTDIVNAITLTPSTTAWTNENVNVTITYGSAISQNRKYGIGSATNNATSNPATQVVTENGTVYAEATDIAGNKVTATLQITNIDKINPTAGTMIMKLGNAAGANYTNDTWTNQSVYLERIIGTDGQSGHNTTTYTVSGANTVSSTSATSIIGNTGTSTVTVTTIDTAGNSSSRSYTVKIDKVAPTVVFGTNGASNVLTASTTATVSDTGGSGLNTSTLQYIWSTSTTAPTSGWTTFTNGSTLTRGSVTGTYYLWIKARDNVGNEIITRSNAFTIDNTPPVAPTISATPTSWTNGNVSVTITYSGDSTVKEYSTNGSTWYTYSSAITVTTNNTTVYARAYDAVGNSSSNSRTITNIDKTNPTISFGTNGGTVTTASTTATVSDTGGSGVATTQYLWTTSSSLVAPSSGWNSYSNGTTLTWATNGTYYLWIKGIDGAGNITTVRSNAFYILNQYTVTFNSMGGSSVSSQQVAYGGYVLQPSNPTRTGYTFGGWYTTTGYTTAWNFYSNTITANRTLYAKWNPITYTVTFNSMSGSSVASQQVAYGGYVSQPSNPTRSGYTFGGWYTTSSYTTSWNFYSNTITANRTLYAKWNPITYTVTFNSMSGSSVASQQVAYGGYVSQPANPTRSGYTFGGWYTTSTCTTAWNFYSNTITANRTLYAKWTTVTHPTLSYQGYMSSWGWGTSYPNSGLGKVLQPTRTGYAMAMYTAIVGGNLSYVPDTYATKWGPLRLEGLKIYINNNPGTATLKVEFNCYTITKTGASWKGWTTVTTTGATSGDINGVNSDRTYPLMPFRGIAAIQMRLTGTAASSYNLQYRAYGPVGTVGSFVTAPSTAGSVNSSNALYGIEIKLLPK
jgi:uncharacterized repeat protein (TIGR02543 family)